jgi:hypothetical protein
MARYEFACTDAACDYTVVIEQPITEPVPDCPDFHLSRDHEGYYPMPMRRIWGDVAVLFRGGGWASK